MKPPQPPQMPQLQPKETRALEPIPAKYVELQKKWEIFRDSLIDISFEDYRKLNKEIAEFANKLREKYGEESRKYVVWHLLSKAGYYAGEGVDIEDDFPGEDSVVTFILKSIEKYSSPDRI